MFPNAETGDCELPGKWMDNFQEIYDKRMRGFEKTPFVKLIRLDITSYLAKMVESTPRKCKVNSIPKEWHIRECLVHVAQHDLDKLKANFHHQNKSIKTDTDQKNSPWHCKICDNVYKTEKTLHNHILHRHIISQSANNKSKKRVSVDENISVNNDVKFYPCSKCIKMFKSYQALRRHMKTKHSKRSCYICHFCSTSFTDRVFFKVHSGLHCEECGDLFSNKSDILDHKQTKCKAKSTVSNVTENNPNVGNIVYRASDVSSPDFTCNVCNIKFETKCSLLYHRTITHDNRHHTEMFEVRHLGSDRLYLCKFCQEPSVDRETIEKHTALLLDTLNVNKNMLTGNYVCDQCRNQFVTESDLLKHKWTHILMTETETVIGDGRSKHQVLDEDPRLFQLLTENKNVTFDVKDGIPQYMRPIVLVEKLRDPEKYFDKLDNKAPPLQDIYSTSHTVPYDGEKISANPDKKRSKTLLSKHQCPICARYYSSNYCLTRHLETQHTNNNTLQCRDCEDIFVWPSLLESHKCVRWDMPEMPFDDARPEVHFDNLPPSEPPLYYSHQPGVDLTFDEDFNFDLEFDIPPPIVELTEYEDTFTFNQEGEMMKGDELDAVSLASKVDYVVHEVPVEF